MPPEQRRIHYSLVSSPTSVVALGRHCKGRDLAVNWNPPAVWSDCFQRAWAQHWLLYRPICPWFHGLWVLPFSFLQLGLLCRTTGIEKKHLGTAAIRHHWLSKSLHCSSTGTKVHSVRISVYNIPIEMVLCEWTENCRECREHYSWNLDVSTPRCHSFIGAMIKGIMHFKSWHNDTF